ncbi:hypothetical protein DUI87_09671 [Hirundo rustica rustica]|uniref:Uncharacterized protein n=1 Tax=Hirundo rustica rustica TaxID=333673 RepID=A0A3M0KND6_HIRRU|nr:hypothetical protein DUI87_09671 [Hirundo rustica rustica]
MTDCLHQHSWCELWRDEFRSRALLSATSRHSLDTSKDGNAWAWELSIPVPDNPFHEEILPELDMEWHHHQSETLAFLQGFRATWTQTTAAKTFMAVVAADHGLGAAGTPGSSLRDFCEEEMLGLIPEIHPAKMVGIPLRSSSSPVIRNRSRYISNPIICLSPELKVFQSLRLNNPSSLSRSSQGFCVPSPSPALLPPLDTLKHLNVLPKLGGPELDTILKVWLHQSRGQGKNDLPAPAGHTIPDPGQVPSALLATWAHCCGGPPGIYPFQGSVAKLKREMRSSGNYRKLNSCPYHMDKRLMAEFLMLSYTRDPLEVLLIMDTDIALRGFPKVCKRLDVLNNVVTPSCL